MKLLSFLFVYFCFFCLFYIVPVSLIAMWTRYEISYWATHMQGKPVDIPYWQAWLATIPYPITLIADAVSMVIRLVQG